MNQDLMKILKLHFVCIFLLISTDNGNAKPKDIHIHLHGIGEEVAANRGIGRGQIGKKYYYDRSMQWFN